MHSNVIASILVNFLPFETPCVSLPTKSSSAIVNLVNLLVEGVVMSGESETLYETGQLAQLLEIKLDGLQLGRKKKSVSIRSSVVNQTKVIKGVRVTESKVQNVESKAVSVISSNSEISEESLADIDVKTEVIESDSQLVEESVSVKKKRKVPSFKIKKGQRKCTYCDKVCKSIEGLKSHMFEHTGGKPFKCDDYLIPGNPTSAKCDKEFATLARLTQHRLIHSEIKPFPCHCGAQFTVKQSLKRHQLKDHGQEDDSMTENVTDDNEVGVEDNQDNSEFTQEENENPDNSEFSQEDDSMTENVTDDNEVGVED